MTKNYNIPGDRQIEYYGNSDLLAQIANELQVAPESCFSKNVLSWYNETYVSSNEFEDCRHQIEIRADLCEQEPPSTIEELVNIIVGFVSGNNRRIANAVIRIVCREALRQVTIEQAPNA